jgi:hypothetical protein
MVCRDGRVRQLARLSHFRHHTLSATAPSAERIAQRALGFPLRCILQFLPNEFHLPGNRKLGLADEPRRFGSDRCREILSRKRPPPNSRRPRDTRALTAGIEAPRI